MNFSNISAWSIRNPVVPIILFIGLLLAGMVSFSRMQVQDNPDVEFPVVLVAISQPGAAPTEVENQITQRVEAAVRALNGVETISSTAREGVSETGIEFQLGVDINQAVNEVKNAIDQARGDLPDGILEPQVLKMETSAQSIADFAVTADDMTIEQLSWFVDDTVAKKLLAVPGMAKVERQGGVNREIRVTLDPARMQSLGVTATQVNSALRQLNTNAAGGKSEIAGSRQSVRVLGNAKTAYDLSQLDVPLGGGRSIKLTDFAHVTDAYSEQTSVAKVNGRQSVVFSISRARGKSDVTVHDEALKVLNKIEKDNPGVRFTRVFSMVDYTKEQYESSISSMVEGAILAVIVVFFFLRDWRATAISAIAIPLSAIPTFWFLHLMGFTLNGFSLLALGLVAGVLVDDAIVEIENIVRHMRMGKSAYQASIDAADEIGLAVVATTFSIVAVFLPVGLMPGVSGQFFKNFGMTVVISVLMSLAVARMITPMVAAYFLKDHGHAEHAGGPWMERYLKVLHWSLDSRQAKAIRASLTEVRSSLAFHIVPMLASLATLFALIAQMTATKPDGSAGMGPLGAFFLALIPALLAYPLAYLIVVVIGALIARFTGAEDHGFLGWARFTARRLKARLRDHRIWMIGVGMGALAMTVGLMVAIPKQLFPNADLNFGQVRVEMVPGTTLRQTVAVVDQVSGLLAKVPEIGTIYSRIGEARSTILLTYRDGRERTSQEIERSLTPELQRFPDARVTFQEINSGGPPSGSGRPISVMLAGSDSELLKRTATTLVQQMSGLKELVAPRINADMRRPELVIRPRFDLAASLGVTTASLSQAIRIATIGDIDQNAAKFSLNDRQVPIRVRLGDGARRDLSVIQNLPVPTATGGSVPLARVADISFGSGPIAIQRYNQQRRIVVGADLAPGVVQGTAQQLVNQLPIMTNLPAGVSNTAFGRDKIFAELIQNFITALISGILLVFAVLVLLYHRFISPLVNMGSLFLAPLGGLIAIAVLGQPMSMPVFIGILMLFGIVAKNSILLIDFAIEEMKLGRSKFDAIVEAGHKRAQPIVMTTVAMTAGMIPTALSLSGDGAFRAPMGTVVIGGLILSTLLTLLIVPAGFSLADGLEKRLGPRMRRAFLTYDPVVHGKDPQSPPQPPAAVPAE